MAWGTLMHGLLEHAMRHKGATRDDLRRLAMWLTVDEPQLRMVIDEALDTVERAAQADFWQLAEATEHSVESPFVVAEVCPADERCYRFAVSVGRRLAGGGYKTDMTLDAKAYEAQLNAYRAALRELGCHDVDAAVVSVRSP